MASEDYYNLLEVSRSASSEEIKKAYRKLALKYHPDKTKGDKDAEVKFKKINEAYQVLSDPTKRQQYDQFGATSGGGGFNRWSGGTSGPEDGWQGAADFSGFTREFDFGDLGGFGDIFDTFFSDRRGKRKSPDRIKRGTDIEANLQITFEDAVFGSAKKVSINRSVSCEECGGTGSADGKLAACEKCKGTGEVKKVQRTILGSFTQMYVCDECGGLGAKPAKVCRQCRGEGRRAKSEMVEVKIPAGIDNRQTIKLPGLGEAGWRGGLAGDLYITVHVLSSKEFRREGWDVYRTENINYPTAVLGGETIVTSLAGKLTLKIPAGTTSGEVFRLKGKGIKHLDKSAYGDLLVRVEIAVPPHLTLKQKRLLEELRDEFTQ